MSRPPRANLKDIIAADVAPNAKEEVPPPAEVVDIETARPAPQRRAAVGKGKAPAPIAEGNIKQRSRAMSLYLEPEVYDQLRDLAHTERAKMHPLILEALDMLFRNRNLPSIRQLEKLRKS